MGATGSAPNGEGARGLVARREPQHHGLEKPADENNEGSEIVPDRKEAAQTGAEVGAVLRMARGGVEQPREGAYGFMIRTCL